MAQEKEQCTRKQRKGVKNNARTQRGNGDMEYKSRGKIE